VEIRARAALILRRGLSKRAGAENQGVARAVGSCTVSQKPDKRPGEAEPLRSDFARDAFFCALLVASHDGLEHFELWLMCMRQEKS
jgi:hypothetical protein